MKTIHQNLAYDNALVGVAEGNTESLAYLYAELKKPVFALAFSILRDHAAAEDIMQETFLRVQIQASQYQTGTSAKAWILSIARNLAKDYLRRRYPETSFLPSGDDDPEPWDEFDKRVESSIDLRHALDSLTYDESEILVLHAVVGFKHREIAEIVGLSPTTVRKVYSRIIAKLRKYYDDADNPLKSRLRAAESSSENKGWKKRTARKCEETP